MPSEDLAFPLFFVLMFLSSAFQAKELIDKERIRSGYSDVVAALSPDGNTLASGSSDESIQLCELPSGRLRPHSLTRPKSSARAASAGSAERISEVPTRNASTLW